MALHRKRNAKEFGDTRFPIFFPKHAINEQEYECPNYGGGNNLVQAAFKPCVTT